MRLPWVPRALYDDARQQIADLKEANLKLLELVGLKQSAPSSAEPEEQSPEPPRPHRKLGAQLRAEWRQQAEERANQSGVKK